MALRGPGRPGATPVKPADTQAPGAKLSNVEKALLSAGVAQTPAAAKKLARVLLGALRGKGVPANTLPLGIKQFQKQMGLKQTGKLDPATLAALQKQGLLPAGEKKSGKLNPGAGQAGAPAIAVPGKADVVVKAPTHLKAVLGVPVRVPRPVGSEGAKTGAPAQKVTIEQTKALASFASPKENFGAQELLQNLSTLGFFAGGRGADQLRGAVSAFQGKANLPATGKLDPETVQKLVQAGVLPESASQQLAQQGAPAASRSAGDASHRQAQEQARSETDQALNDALLRGVPEGQGDPAATSGRGAKAKGKAKKRGQGGEGDGFESAGTGGPADDEDGSEAPDANAPDANAPAGDDDVDDEERGHAQLQSEAAEEGHYAIAPLSEQLATRLEEIERDDDGRGPVTYRWDVTFYKPGVYGARQPAEPLWHLGIEKVTAFDEVWARACQALAERMAKLEPDREPPVQADFERALRRARARSTP